MAGDDGREAGSPAPARGGGRWAPAASTAWARTADGLAVVMNMERGEPLLLSASGSLVWEILIGGRTPDQDLASVSPQGEDEIVAGVAEAVGVPPTEVGANVVGFLSDLADRGLVRAPL